MHDHPSYLFEGTSVYDFILSIQTRAMDRLKAQNENVMLSTPMDDLVAELVAACALQVPELRDSETWVEEKEMSRDVPLRGYDIHMDRHRGSRTVTSHVVSFHVPFDGDANLFTIQPSNRTIPGPAADVMGQELIIKITTDRKTSDQVKQEYDSQVQSIKQHLSTSGNNLRSIGAHIENPARTYIEQRKAQLLTSKNLVASLGFPMKRRPDAPTTYRAPEVRRKLTPVRPQIVAPFKPEPTLDEAEYQHILGVMDNMTKVMERSPHTFENMAEEDIRQQFLVQLNGQYEGQATGETFNFHGKTDILIRSEGRNIFIAECKFWRGEKGFLEAVDQLLSYLSWRDSKIAIVIFNKNRSLSGVLTSIQKAMETHAHKRRGPKTEGETRFRYIMGNTNDTSREVIMTVMVYDIPVPQ